MSVFEAAIDALFDDPNLAVAGLYRAGGTALDLPVRVIRRQPDRIGEFGVTRLRSETTVFELRTSEVPSPAEGDTLSVGGIGYAVQGEPIRDAERLVWTIEARPA
jgi:hypothetical protein